MVETSERVQWADASVSLSRRWTRLGWFLCSCRRAQQLFYHLRGSVERTWSCAGTWGGTWWWCADLGPAGRSPARWASAAAAASAGQRPGAPWGKGSWVLKASCAARTTETHHVRAEPQHVERRSRNMFQHTWHWAHAAWREDKHKEIWVSKNIKRRSLDRNNTSETQLLHNERR